MAKEEKNDKKENLGITVKKEDDYSEWYTQVIQKAELAEYTDISGCIVFRPYAYAIWEKVQRYFDDKIKKMGVKNAYFPLFIPEHLLTKESEHVEGFSPEVAWVTHAGDSELTERLAIRPTSETIMYDTYAKWIRSHRDLPLKINQWCSVVRWEFKHAVPFLRTREFLWQEGHNVFATENERDEDVLKMLDAYTDVFENLYAIPVLKGRKSDKEKFAGADYTTSVETLLPNGKAIQGATSHALSQNFAKSFGIEFVDKDEQKKYPWQDSWGLSTRSLGIMILMHGDDKGLVVPPRIAPIQVVIVPIYKENDKEQVLEKVREVKKHLGHLDIEVDDREEFTPGYKYNHWEMRGVPLRIEIGPKDIANHQATIARRDTGAKEHAKFDEVNSRVKELLDEIHENLLSKARKAIEANTLQVESFDEFKKGIADKKMVYAPWCGGVGCEDYIKDESGGAKTLNVPFGQKKPSKKCVYCGNEAKHYAYFAKSY